MKPDDSLEELLDQPAAADPFHPHLQVKPSTDVDRDLQQMMQLIYALEVRRRSAEKMSQQDADSWANLISSLACKVKNRVAE
jgi:hypothetical protein